MQAVSIKATHVNVSSYRGFQIKIHSFANSLQERITRGVWIFIEKMEEIFEKTHLSVRVPPAVRGVLR